MKEGDIVNIGCFSFSFSFCFVAPEVILHGILECYNNPDIIWGDILVIVREE